jgi:hypothetical protein
MPQSVAKSATTGRVRPRLISVPSGRKCPVLRFLDGSEWVVHRDGTMTPKPKPK